MSQETILLADNLPAFVKGRKEFLEKAGYKVIEAYNPEDTIRILENGGIDLALIDMRLKDDNDDNDISGLDIARTTTRAIPKIIITDYPNWEAVRIALGIDDKGVSPADDYLSKKEGLKAMLGAIVWTLHRPILKRNILSNLEAENRKAIPDRIEELGVDETAGRLKQSYEELYEFIQETREEERARARSYHKWALVLSIVSFVVLLVGAFFAYFNLISAAAFTTISGALLQSMSVLFYKREDKAIKQMYANYNKRDDLVNIAELLSIIDTFPNQETNEQLKKMVIEKIIEKWD